MKIAISLFLILSSQLSKSGSATEEHIHFKIYVPEIINHQVHTKTVFIHVPKFTKVILKKPKPKEEPPKTYHKEIHHEDWSSWSSYGYNDDHGEKPGNDHDLSKNAKGHSHDRVEKEMIQKNINRLLKYHRDSYMPMLQHDAKANYLREQPGDTMGYSYPPQYAVQEDVKEIDNNEIDPYMNMYEEGYRRGAESEMGHAYSDDLTKYYDDQYEEGDQSAEEYKSDSREKTHAGRYFVDDSEYQRNNEKYDAEKRTARGVLASF